MHTIKIQVIISAGQLPNSILYNNKKSQAFGLVKHTKKVISHNLDGVHIFSVAMLLNCTLR